MTRKNLLNDFFASVHTKGVGKIYQKRGRSGGSGANVFLHTVNHGAQNSFPFENHGADTFSGVRETTGRRLF